MTQNLQHGQFCPYLKHGQSYSTHTTMIPSQDYIHFTFNKCTSSSLVWPAYVACLSILALVVRSARWRTYVSKNPLNRVYQFTRLAGCLFLLGLSLRMAFYVPKTSTKISCNTLLPLFTDTVLTLLAMSTTTSHLEIALLASLAVYVYRDLWPLATFDQVPQDIQYGYMIWSKLLLLFILAIVHPIVTPRDKNAKFVKRRASWFSLVTHSYLDPLVFRRGHDLTLDMIPLPDEDDKAVNFTEAALEEIDPLLTGRHRYLFWSLCKIFRSEVLTLMLLQNLLIVAGFVSQVGLNRLLGYLENPAQATIRPWLWIFCLFAGPVLCALLQSTYTAISTRNVVVIESMLTHVLFTHSLRAKIDSVDTPGVTKRNLVGRINNLATTDVSNITGVSEFWIVTLFFPLKLLLCMTFLYVILDWSALVGLAVMIICLPIPGFISSRLQSIQQEKMRKTDARVEKVVEMMGILRMVKFLGWEPKIKEQISAKRKEEIRLLRKSKLLELLGSDIYFLIPLFVMITTLATYTLVLKRTLTASTVFSALSVFDTIRISFRQVLVSLPNLIKGKVSLDRYGDFLKETELLDSFSDPDSQTASPPDIIGFRNASFTWDRRNSFAFRLRIDGDLFFRPGITLITGATATGKTSLLMALLGEMHFIPAPDSYYNLPREGGVAYAVQESWIQNQSIKENILFGASFDEERYRKVLYQCALLPDLELLDEDTEVGERGITLSGGQKARITLARAIYSTASILLLDDPFAALDVHTSQWIVDKCFKDGDLIQGRTILLVTHNVPLVRPIAQYVVTLTDGNVKHGDPADMLEDYQETAVSEDVDELAHEVPLIDPKPQQAIKIKSVEETETGSVKWSSWKLYFNNLSSHSALFWISWIGILFLNEGANTYQAWLLGSWSAEYKDRPASDVSADYYLTGYAVLLMISVLLYSISSIIFMVAQLRAARRIHDLLIESVLGATLGWLDKTPVSRVIARATMDISSVDRTIPFNLSVFTEFSVLLLVKMGSIVLFQWRFIFPGAFIISLCLFIGRMYMSAQLPIKRLMSNARSPILAHLSGAAAGITSVRAYGAQSAFLDESLSRIDLYVHPALTYWNLNRWISIRTETLGGVFTASLAAYIVYVKGANASEAGFSLIMAVILSPLILLYVRSFNNLEITGNNLERIDQYLHIEHEPKPTSEGIPPASWPCSGEIRIEGLSARYSQDGPNVLHNISLTIASGERIGVVGRTGSGKSSLVLALLRCIPTEGEIYYDGMPTSAMNLDILRANITSIPQVPELISGTLRENLDPFSMYDDLTLRSALRSAGFDSVQGDGSSNLDSLDSVIAGGGVNLSVGVRQITALARAIVRESRVLILDEATSAIDYKTDMIIQESLRNELPGVTLITVAHRLQTIMDFDKIMVLDKGCLVEYDTPAKLLENPHGFLRALVEESSEKDRLVQMAKRKNSD
ncbi:multidrug resistance-associated ABC transporter [Mycena floridula]|nr:multidrug resistance-associated ABC transporter [Mycena floridula]